MQNQVLTAIGRMSQPIQSMNAASQTLSRAEQSFNKGASLMLKMDRLLGEEEARLQNNVNQSQKMLMAGIQQSNDMIYKERQFAMQEQQMANTEAQRGITNTLAQNRFDQASEMNDVNKAAQLIKIGESLKTWGVGGTKIPSENSTIITNQGLSLLGQKQLTPPSALPGQPSAGGTDVDSPQVAAIKKQIASSLDPLINANPLQKELVAKLQEGGYISSKMIGGMSADDLKNWNVNSPQSLAKVIKPEKLLDTYSLVYGSNESPETKKSMAQAILKSERSFFGSGLNTEEGRTKFVKTLGYDKNTADDLIDAYNKYVPDKKIQSQARNVFKMQMNAKAGNLELSEEQETEVTKAAKFISKAATNNSMVGDWFRAVGADNLSDLFKSGKTNIEVDKKLKEYMLDEIAEKGYSPTYTMVKKIASDPSGYMNTGTLVGDKLEKTSADVSDKLFNMLGKNKKEVLTEAPDYIDQSTKKFVEVPKDRTINWNPFSGKRNRRVGGAYDKQYAYQVGDKMVAPTEVGGHNMQALIAYSKSHPESKFARIMNSFDKKLGSAYLHNENPKTIEAVVDGKKYPIDVKTYEDYILLRRATGFTEMVKGE